MERRRIKLEEKFILLIIVIGLACFGFLGHLSYTQISKIIIAQNKDYAMDLAKTAASEIDGDLFAGITSTDADAYQQIYQTLSHYKENSIINYIYALKQDGEQMAFVIDTDTAEPAEFMESYPYIDSMRPVFSGEACCDAETTSDRWGEYYSAYAPIFDSKGNVVGMVGCDITVEHINDLLHKLKYMIIPLIAVFALITIFSSIWISQQLITKDPIAEIPNYDKLIKDGQRMEKKNKLAEYSAIMYEIKGQKFLMQKTGASNGDLIVKEYAKDQNKKIKRGDHLYSIGNGRFLALIRKEKEQLYLDAVRKKDITIKGKDGDLTLSLEFSCGVFQIREKDQIQDVFNYCSLALDSANEHGDAEVQWFEEEMIEMMVNEREVINAFRTGLVRHEFVVYYQPKVNLDTNRLCGAEALVRWYKNGKIVPPDLFVPVLEKNNMITDLDFYVFEQVCKDINYWLEKGYDVVRISSNFSKLHLKNPYFAEELMDIVNKYHIDTKYIEVELTESSGYYDLKALEGFVGKMNDAHIFISIDDFGTGYSSLSLLKDLEFDVVKMDKSFFRDIEKGDRVNEKMVENIIRVVQDLNREIISEGIETEGQAMFLKNIKAPVVQGYLYDKPLPHNEFEDRLRNPVYAK